jgi:hypothetical protein
MSSSRGPHRSIMDSRVFGGSILHADSTLRCTTQTPFVTCALQWPLTWAPRRLLINSPFPADTIRAPRVPLYG